MQPLKTRLVFVCLFFSPYFPFIIVYCLFFFLDSFICFLVFLFLYVFFFFVFLLGDMFCLYVICIYVHQLVLMTLPKHLNFSGIIVALNFSICSYLGKLLFLTLRCLSGIRVTHIFNFCERPSYIRYGWHLSS